MKCADPGGRSVDQLLDSLPHLACGPLGEGHHEHLVRRDAARHESPVSLRNHGRLAGARACDHPYRSARDGRGELLLATEPESGARAHIGVARPIRTRRARTLRPRSDWLSLATIVSESSRSW